MHPLERSRASTERGAVESSFTFSGFDTDTPIVAVSLHSGHGLRPDVEDNLALAEADRLREEDPFMDLLSGVVDARVRVHSSRFEVDLNRAGETCVYRSPAEAFGLDVWRAPPTPAQIDRCRDVHVAFYREMARHLQAMQARFGRFVVFDLHSYNHRRRGPGQPPGDPFANPEINIGTGSMDRSRWSGLVDRFIQDFAVHGQLDVRENVRFRGGYFPTWVHRTFPESGCALAIEVKKTFMDEWTGQLDQRQLARVRGGLAATVPGIVEALAQGR